jgi:hypothetical protein
MSSDDEILRNAAAADTRPQTAETRARQAWLIAHFRTIKTELIRTKGIKPLEVDAVLFGMLRGERAMPDDASAILGVDEEKEEPQQSFKSAFMTLAAEYAWIDRQRLVREFNIEWQRGAAARRVFRRANPTPPKRVLPHRGGAPGASSSSAPASKRARC